MNRPHEYWRWFGRASVFLLHLIGPGASPALEVDLRPATQCLAPGEPLVVDVYWRSSSREITGNLQYVYARVPHRTDEVAERRLTTELVEPLPRMAEFQGVPVVVRVVGPGAALDCAKPGHMEREYLGCVPPREREMACVDRVVFAGLTSKMLESGAYTIEWAMTLGLSARELGATNDLSPELCQEMTGVVKVEVRHERARSLGAELTVPDLRLETDLSCQTSTENRSSPMILPYALSNVGELPWEALRTKSDVNLMLVGYQPWRSCQEARYIPALRLPSKYSGGLAEGLRLEPGLTGILSFDLAQNLALRSYGSYRAVLVVTCEMNKIASGSKRDDLGAKGQTRRRTLVSPFTIDVLPPGRPGGTDLRPLGDPAESSRAR